MRNDWVQTTVGDLLRAKGGSIKTGPFGTVLKANEYSTDGVPVISVGEIGYGSFRLHQSTPRVPPAVLARLPEYVLKAGDIVFGRKGAVDRSALIRNSEEGWFLGSDGIRLRLPDECDPFFFAYQLQNPATRAWLLQHATGTTMASLNQGVIERIPIVVPPLFEQREMAGILRPLDEKLDLNRSMNQTLEAMAQTLFRSWFVDFDPVRAKAEGRQPERMDAETAALFPNRFVESVLGTAPEGWAIQRLGDILELKRGYDLPSSQRVLGAVPVISSSGASGWHNEPKIPGPGIVTGRYGSIGEVFLVREAFWPLNTTLYVRDLKRNNLIYAYHLLRLLDFNKFSDKAAVPGINRNHLHEERLVAAPRTLQERFADLASPLLELAAKNTAQTTTLAALRDTLLPKLLSGKIRIRDVKAQLAATA
ncbi:restriction endonuclease subunit S [Corallococcus interemptor]|uniref:restriction endonuclease subunit S n=1 Tax=Corallococcus interemptor TaxID=2316720 RepID=UPI003CFD9C4B